MGSFLQNDVVLSFDDILLVYNTFFENHAKPERHVLTDLELKLLCFVSDQVGHVLEMIYGISCLGNILVCNTFFVYYAEPWLSNSQFELDLLSSESEELVLVLKLFFRNYAISCFDTMVYNTYFDVHFECLKQAQHVLRKKHLVIDHNKNMSCLYDTGYLVSVLSVQDQYVQSQRSVRNESKHYAYQPEIWRWKYLRKMASKLQGSFCPKP